MTTGMSLPGRVVLDERDEADAVHPRHVHVGHDQVVVHAADGIPAVHAVHGHVDGEAAGLEQLPLELTDGDRIVDDENPLPAPGLGRPSSRIPPARAAGP